MNRRIDLAQLTGDGEVRNLSGHERGVRARELFRLAEIDIDNGVTEVDVVIPDDVYSISSSFFQGMFSESVRALGGRNKFLSKYKFSGTDVVLQQISRGIDASLMRRGSIVD